MKRWGWIALLLVGCGGIAPPAKLPVFVVVQASPDGSALETIAPTDWVSDRAQLGSALRNLPPDPYTLWQVGQPAASLFPQGVFPSEAFGAVVTFKLATPLDVRHPLRRQPRGAMLVPKGVPPAPDVTRYTCPPDLPRRLQPAVAAFGQKRLNLSAARARNLAFSHLECVDLTGDRRPEILAGVRFDNPQRPLGNQATHWQSFLALPAIEREEYSLALVLRPQGETWSVEPIALRARALAFLGDSVGSYAVHSVRDLDGDGTPEVLLLDIGLNTVDLVVARWDGRQWLSYYRDRPLDIVQ
ncbi:MAG: hypothetical protein ACUVSQ_00575 [Pseudanabaenaceae cyanobacterium]